MCVSLKPSDEEWLERVAYEGNCSLKYNPVLTYFSDRFLARKGSEGTSLRSAAKSFNGLVEAVSALESGRGRAVKEVANHADHGLCGLTFEVTGLARLYAQGPVE